MTPLSDYPTNNQPIRRAVLTFTLYVVPTADYTTVLSLQGTGARWIQLRKR